MPRHTRAAAARAEQAAKIEEEWFGKVRDDTDPAADPPTCPATSEAEGIRYICNRHDKHDPDPAANGHYWVTSKPAVALVRPASNDGADNAIGATVIKLAHLAELDHWANVYSYQVKTVATLSGLLAEAADQLGDPDGRRHVDPEIVAKIHRQVDGWAIQCGANNARGDRS